jgi:hypothetical protein
VTQPSQNQGAFSKHSHYVSLHNGVIYPAMTGLPGHEDANPSDWRPATATEVERYRAGQQTVDVSPIPLGESAPVAPNPAAPTTLQLAPDDVPAPVIPPAGVQEAPVVAAKFVPPAPSAAPAVAIPAAPKAE